MNHYLSYSFVFWCWANW